MRTRVEVRLSPSQMETLAGFSSKKSAQDGIYNLANLFEEFEVNYDDLASLYKLFDFLKDFKEIPQYSGFSLSFLLARLPAIIILLAATRKEEPEPDSDLHLKSFSELLKICQGDKEKYQGFSKFARKEDLIKHIRACNSLESDSKSYWIC